MSILDSDVKLLKSEHMTDLSDSGGFPSGNEVLDNVDNNVFPDISSGDRVTGRAQTRLIYGAVRSPDTDVYMGSRAYIASPPSDAAVDVAIFPSVAGCDQETLLEPLYRYTLKGSNTNYRMYATYDVGASLIQFYYALNQTLQPTSGVSTTLILEDIGNNSFQVVNAQQGWSWVNGVEYSAWSVSLSQPLRYEFRGALYSDLEHASYVTPTQIYYTAPQEIPIYGIRALSAQTTNGTASVSITNNSFLLGPRVGYVVNSTAQPEGAFDGEFVQSFTCPTTGRTFALPVVSPYFDLIKVVWLTAPFQYTTYSVSIHSEDYFLVTLPQIVNSGTYLTYYTSGYTQGTDFVFQLKTPVIPGSLSLNAISITSTLLSAVDDGVGGFTGAGVSSGTVDYDTGLGEITLSATCLTSNVTLDYQYTAYLEDMEFEEIGIDLSRLPPSKTTPLFRVGDSVLIHNTLHQTLVDNPVVSSTTYTLSRANVDQIWLEAANGTRIPTAKYTKNLTAGSVTMGAALDLTGYSQPLEAYTTIQDEAVIVAISSDGETITLNRNVTHTYPGTTSYLSSIIKSGDLFASANDPFSQQAVGTPTWSDVLYGSPITPQYNNVTYPIEVTNDGAITERWRIHFTGTTTVNIIGERVGQIATGLSITSDIAPINPHTLNPYFTIQSSGWGAGWVSGNLLRFNTESADTPIGVIRVVQPSVHVPGTSDRFRLTFLGDVDA
ncbi:MAG: hypothetical protein IPP74_15145 [Alphaproteobacteria bacterium]|nr:hypothetical protein [Alphaproteobacteria bacterium]